MVSSHPRNSILRSTMSALLHQRNFFANYAICAFARRYTVGAFSHYCFSQCFILVFMAGCLKISYTSVICYFGSRCFMCWLVFFRHPIHIYTFINIKCLIFAIYAVLCREKALLVYSAKNTYELILEKYGIWIALRHNKAIHVTCRPHEQSHPNTFPVNNPGWSMYKMAAIAAKFEREN